MNVELESQVKELKGQLATLRGALEKILWTVNVGIVRDGADESKVRIQGIIEAALEGKP